MNHAEWTEAVNTAYAWTTMLHNDTAALRLYVRVLRTRPVSIVGRTVAHALYQLELIQ